MFVAVKRIATINGHEVWPPSIVEVTATVGRGLINNDFGTDVTGTPRLGAQELRAHEMKVEPRRRYRVVREFSRLNLLATVGALMELPESVGDELASQGFMQREGAPASHPLAERAARY